MYLKALEIQGFKSFPEKTRLEFDKSITAIVGPNGSGKSNISDALRWVMGEQSTRNLRGGKMEDVIFGGTEKRNPVGFAQVSLIIDNSSRIFNVDNTEIMITRRYYRSGESDYYINRQSVRLRDINELLMDTGLGRDGYSIIGQGRIDEILSVRSSDRREIFEEAAGISRYRYRKEESERKLERTGENLLRVNDKIAELELQVEPLRKQSETAKKFLLLRDELRGLEVSVWCESIDRLRAQSIKIASEYDTAARQLEDSRSSIENIYAEMEKLSEDMHDKEKNAEEQRNVISGMEAQTAELESAIAVLETNIKNCEDVIERINEEISEQENRAIGIGDQISERKSRIVEIDFSRQKLAEEQAALLSEVAGLSENADTAAGELSLILRGIADETELTSGARAKLSALESTVAELKSREETIASEISRIKERLETETQNEKRVRKELSESQDAATSAENIIKGHEIRLLSRKNKASELGDGKTQLTIAKENISSRIALLTEMEKVFAGFSNAVRMVMQESSRGNLRGIHGPVANLIKTEDRYALAVETALGASTQSIIVDSEEAGKAAINLLKRRDGGRGTFLPISTIRGYELNESGVKNEDGFEGYALSLVEFDKKYEGIYASLLGRIVVARDLDSAVKIGKKYSYRFRIVTLDGQVINTGGSMTGGSASKNTGILSRANELKALEIKFEQTQKELSELLTRLSEAERELVSANDEADIARNELRTAQDSMLRLKTESEHLNLLTESLRASLETLEKEGSTIKSRQKELNDAISGLRHEINEREEKVQTLRKRADDISEGKEELRKKNEELSDRIADMRAQAASLDAEKAAISAAAKELETLALTLGGDKGRKEQKISELRAQIDSLKAEILQKRERLLSGMAQTDQHRNQLSELIDEKLGLEAKRTRQEKESQDKNRELLNLERELSRLEQKKLSAELEEKQLVDKLWDGYELSVTAAQSVKIELESVQKASRRISELRREISALGPPNIGAIDEFERVNTRYTYLTEQRDDIEKAKAELEQIIKNITSEMKVIFAREFEAINESFKQTFLELFGGGKAELKLEDESDILNCGIEIRVQPPGKSLKTITLLSGGEKAFVAIAIYFAILKVRPTPFCVLDEIEAALDDVNVLRFSDYLRALSGRTQFLIITHRRGTMENAEALYGVTMQEQGVSRVLSIDLEEAEKSMSA